MSAWRREYGERYYQRNKERILAKQRAYHFKKKLKAYGITEEIYNRVLEEQAKACAVCKAPPPENRRLDADHCHKTGRFRGLLCNPCNQALGLLADDTNRIEGLLSYLSRQEIA